MIDEANKINAQLKENLPADDIILKQLIVLPNKRDIVWSLRRSLSFDEDLFGEKKELIISANINAPYAEIIKAMTIFKGIQPTERRGGILDKIKEEEKEVEGIFTKLLVFFKKSVGNAIVKGNAAVDQALSLTTSAINAPVDMVEATGRSLTNLAQSVWTASKLVFYSGALLGFTVPFANFTFGVAKNFFGAIENQNLGEKLVTSVFRNANNQNLINNLSSHIKIAQMTHFASPYAALDSSLDEIQSRAEAYEKYTELNAKINDQTILEFALFQEQKYDLKRLGVLEEQYKQFMALYSKNPESQSLAYNLYQNSKERKEIIEDLEFTQRILKEKFGKKGIYLDFADNVILSENSQTFQSVPTAEKVDAKKGRFTLFPKKKEDKSWRHNDE